MREPRRPAAQTTAEAEYHSSPVSVQAGYHRECVQVSLARSGIQLKGQGLMVRSTVKEVARKEPQGLSPDTQHTQSQTQGPWASSGIKNL